MDKQKALQLLKDTDKTLDALDLSHFVTDGTLLGALRGADFIDHDDDLDMGVFTTEFNDALIGNLILRMRNKGIQHHHTFGEFPDYFEMAFKRDGIKIDLFFYRKEGDKYVFHAFQNGGRDLPDDVITYEYPAQFVKVGNSLNQISIQGERFPAPANPYSFVQHKYGEDWHTPKKEWDWKFDPKNVVK